MAGFLRKVAGAFVHIEDDAHDTSSARAGADLEQITRDASELLTQLEGPKGGRAAASAAAGKTPGPELLAGPSAASGPIATSAMGYTADQVFTAAGLVDGANSAQRVLKLLAGLSMFPAEQQLVMVRAMDAADESWSEPAVLEDARRRQSALRGHLQAVEGEKAARVRDLDLRVKATDGEGRGLVADIDRRIAELQTKRQAAVVETTRALDELEKQKQALEAEAEKARRGITQVINALSSLITFFSGQRPAA